MTSLGAAEITIGLNPSLTQIDLHVDSGGVTRGHPQFLHMFYVALAVGAGILMRNTNH